MFKSAEIGAQVCAVMRMFSLGGAWGYLELGLPGPASKG